MSKLTPIQQAFFNEVVFYGKRRTKPLEAYMLSAKALLKLCPNLVVKS